MKGQRGLVHQPLPTENRAESIASEHDVSETVRARARERESKRSYFNWHNTP